jgi:hypothetical protein
LRVYGENYRIAQLATKASDMSISLPDSVATFFQVSNGAAPSALRRAFSEKSVVHDEGQPYKGHEEIEAWLAEAQRKYAYCVEPLTAVQDDAGVTVVARYVGNFPGTPADLKHVFRLTDNQIDFLKIH